MDDTAAGTTPGRDGEAVTAGDGFVVERRSLQIEWLASGPLVPWLGPAIRGIVAARLRDAVCTWPAPLRATQWLYCRGCPSMAGCGYGRLFERDLCDPWASQEYAAANHARSGRRAAAGASNRNPSL